MTAIRFLSVFNPTFPQQTGRPDAMAAVVRALQMTQPQPQTEIAVMLSGGGARAAYQVALIRGLAKHFPDLTFRIVTGVSAGAINAMFLAGRRGSLAEKADQLSDLWGALECNSIWRFDWWKPSFSATSTTRGRGSPSPAPPTTSPTAASKRWR
ncbi:MAG TPA: patatin-like phospholipase family protein [Thermoanaerobaculia bacterium]|nr:patatin-like phospholipase family protein [Thermoanaerobaculia bacterium]